MAALSIPDLHVVDFSHCLQGGRKEEEGCYLAWFCVQENTRKSLFNVQYRKP